MYTKFTVRTKQIRDIMYSVNGSNLGFSSVVKSNNAGVFVWKMIHINILS